MSAARSGMEGLGKHLALHSLNRFKQLLAVAAGSLG